MNTQITTAGGNARMSNFLRAQMRNIAPFATLLCLVGFFCFASPSFATLDNLANIPPATWVNGPKFGCGLGQCGACAVQ